MTHWPHDGRSRSSSSGAAATCCLCPACYSDGGDDDACDDGPDSSVSRTAVCSLVPALDEACIASRGTRTGHAADGDAQSPIVVI